MELDLVIQRSIENEDHNMASGYGYPSYAKVQELPAFGHPLNMPYLWGGGGVYLSCLDHLHSGEDSVDQHAYEMASSR